MEHNLPKSSPLGIPIGTSSKGVTNSPNMGQPMSSSYENRWLSANEDINKKNSVVRRKSITSENKSTAKDTTKKKENNTTPATTTKPHGEFPKKSQKEMTKAERRALQEKQRLEKANRIAAGLPKSAKQAAELEAKKAAAAAGGGAGAASAKSSTHHQQGDNSGLDVNSNRQTNKKKALSKNQQNQVPWLVHLEAPKTNDALTKDLHPAVLQLGLYFSEHKIVGSNARCVAMLEVFSKVISDHKPPSDATFSRHIQKHLDPHIAYLLSIRPMSLSMRECIRWLKKEMADIVEEDPPLSDDDARKRLIERIGHFIRERITMADKLIVQNGLQKIQDGDVILTYAKSSVVESLLLETKKKGIDFKVIVVDSRPLFEGKRLLRQLVDAGIDCSYYLLSSVYIALKSVTKVIMGAHALLNNGAVYSRIGSSMIAMAASDKQIPVMICCETYKFVNRTQVDSFVLNELGNPDDLVNTKSTHWIDDEKANNSAVLATWRDQPDLRLLNLLYDVTPSKYITLVVTEVGLIPCTSAPVIWREYK
ncbi:uncharacterized protein BX663DRAFT_530160 [Cokeromyces recurvatus]|uniref:uncharacterized protein n=1 Tax=Cokeromyces recurvatus TaxID=90255 RepID=UPI002220EDAD|nr:uncharacterized protein BX663DRAFT_530160 [Cokeromyces recurvatus]KAI7904646.1 hypothetical protein BX663DRAFT_530160 [Cokeromyces recurvatus]